MGFETLLGNTRLKENICRSIARGRVSHFYLISGPEGSGKHTLANLLAASLLCSGAEKPCLTCSHCRKVLSGSHPDYITVDDPEKKTVPVDLIRQARADIYVRPNEGARKIYLFPRAQDMGIPGQNALLKVLEEPPEYGVFLLLTDNPNALLPTIRSRCTHLALTGLPEAILLPELSRRFPQASREDLQAAAVRSGGYLGQALALLDSDSAFAPQTLTFAESFLKKDTLRLTTLLVSMERLKRDQAAEIFSQWYSLLESALMCRSGMDAIAPQARAIGAQYGSAELMQAVQALKKAILYTKSNVSVAAVCGWLTYALQ